MATATTTYEKKITGVMLFLTEKEAQIILTLTGSIHGHHPLRELTDSIYNALRDSGVKNYYYDKLEFKLYDGIKFSSFTFDEPGVK